MKEKTIDGIVVKVTDKSIVLLCADGKFNNVPRDHSSQIPRLGQKFSHLEKQRSSSFNYIRYLSIATILMLAIVAYTILPLGINTAYIIAMDINPSIEMTLDKDLRVQDIYGLNEDGRQLVEALDAKGLHLYMVIDEIIGSAGSKG